MYSIFLTQIFESEIRRYNNTIIILHGLTASVYRIRSRAYIIYIQLIHLDTSLTIFFFFQIIIYLRITTDRNFGSKQ